MSGSGWSMASMTLSQILAGAAFQVCCPGLIPQRAQKMQRPQMNVPVGEGLQGQRRGPGPASPSLSRLLCNGGGSRPAGSSTVSAQD